MPANAQTAPQPAHPQPTHPQQPQAYPGFPGMGHHLRQVVHGHPQMMAHLANGNVQAGAVMNQQPQVNQDQVQAHAAAAQMMAAPYAMYSYPGGMQHGRVPPQYGWVNMPRGMHNAQMMQQQQQQQQQLQQQQQQQMQMGTGKMQGT